MAETGFTRLPVVEREPSGKVAGVISLEDMQRGRARSLTEERERETSAAHPPAVPDAARPDGPGTLTAGVVSFWPEQIP